MKGRAASGLGGREFWALTEQAALKKSAAVARVRMEAILTRESRD